jgi:ferrochelatase
MKGVLLIGFGGPEKAEDVRPFLDKVLEGRPITPERYEEVVRQYERIGGASPFNRLTRELADHLKKQMTPLSVYVGMRHSSPSIADALNRMAQDGVTDATGIILSSFRSEPSWNRYREAVQQAQQERGTPTPTIHYLEPWNEDPLYIQAQADRVQETLMTLPPPRREKTHWIFTAHSIPVSADTDSGYSSQITQTARLTAKRLGCTQWTVAYQSRSGRPEDPWLGPDIGEVLSDLTKSPHKDVLIIPVGFLIDHAEVLFDLDIKARTQAEKVGLHFLRAKTIGHHPAFLQLLAQRILS